jgi:hypothetical protein
MNAQPVLDLFEEREAVVPSCWRCGARGEEIVVDGLAVLDFGAATKWALLEIWAHDREFHPEVRA